MEMSKTVLITGVAGLLGSRLAEHLIEKGITVVGIDNLSGGIFSNIPKEVDLFELDLAHDNLSECFEKYNFDYVFHFAAYAAEGLSPFIRKFNYTNNLISTANVINECIRHQVTRLIFTSTMATYGEQEVPFDERQTPNPIDPYGIAKYACEMDIQVAGDQHGLDWCIIRPHNVYGRNQNIWDKYRNVLGIWMYQYLNGEPMTIYGDGEQKRAFSCIDDSLEPLWTSAIEPSASKQIINLGGIREITIKDASKVLRDVIGDGEIIHLEKRHEVKHAWATYEKSVNILNFEHKTTLESGLTNMWEWAKNQPNRDRFEWSSFELDKGIYDYWKVKK